MKQCSGPPKGGAEMKGLPFAVNNIAEELSQLVDEWTLILQESVWTVLVPGIVVFILITIAATVVWRIHKMMHPPDAPEVHRQALLLLMKETRSQSSQQQRVTVQQRQDHVEVLNLLIQAVAQDPTYLPARLSLAALYLYRLSDGQAALNICQELELDHVQGVVVELPKDVQAQVQGLLCDAQAMISGQGHMVQADLQEERFLRPILLPPSTPKPVKSVKKGYSIDKDNDTSIKRKRQ